MAMVKTPRDNVGQNSVKRKKKNNKGVKTYCVLCRKEYLKHKAQNHMHSMQHHRRMETVLGKDSRHECHACAASPMGFKEFAQHVSTPQHSANLKILASAKVKPLSLAQALGQEALTRILEHNKAKKKDHKKALLKKKKKLKKAAVKRAEMQQGPSKKNQAASKISNLEKCRQEHLRFQQQVTYPQGRNNAVVQNKENKVLIQQRAFRQRESALQNQSGRLACFSVVRDQLAHSAQQQVYDNTVSGELRAQSSQTDVYVRRPHNMQGGASQLSWPQINQRDYYNKQYDVDFTSDHLPQDGAIVFGHGANESSRTSHPGQERPAQPANPANASAAPIRDVDVSSMLRQIRRALGVREPCRADREARKQSSQAGHHSTTRHTGAGKEEPAGGSYTRETAPLKPKLETRGTAPHCEKSSTFASDSDGQKPLNAQTSPAQGLTSPSEPNVNSTRKVRIAHGAARVQQGKEDVLKSTLNKLLSLSGAKSKVNLKEMHQDMRKKQERFKGMPRFGIELTNRLSGQESSTQAADRDATLSEGFHWESVPDSPSSADCVEVPPPPQDTTVQDFKTETRSGSQTEEPVERPGAAQEGCSRQTVAVVSVKTEPRLEAEDGGLRANSSATSKRKLSVHEDISENQSSGKKKKTKSNKADQDQMDQLLAVSLREDELSHSLQDLDKSLVQARNALQAAYTDVQRLLLLRQQFTAEVNSLRAQRIEILQGMKASNAASTSSAAAPPRLSPLPSSGAFPSPSRHQPSPTNPAPSVSPLALPTMPAKQEAPTAAQAGPFAKTFPCSSEGLQVPVSQPVPLFPSDLLPPLLLPPPPHIAAPTAALTSLQPLRTDCSPSGITNNFPESSGRQQPASSAREEAQTVDSDSEEETGGSRAKETEPAAEEPVSKSQPAPAAPPGDDGGNESDASVKVMESPDWVIIDIAESENEDVTNVQVHQESPPQTSASVELSHSSTQTRQQNEAERKVEPTAVKLKDDDDSPECVGVVEDEDPSVGAFENHTGPVHGLQVHEGRLYTCSGDNTARAYSLSNRECQAVFEGHTNKVNCLLVLSLPNMLARLYTGSSDQTIRCYSTKTTKCLEQVSLSDRVLCLHVSWNILYAGLANGAVASHDVKTLKPLDVFECHGPRGVSCLGTAQEGARRVLLVGSYDSTISVRDAKSGLLLRSLQGHSKTVLCLKVVNDLVFSGSSDTSVHAHNIHTGELVRIYKGHNHAVTSIVILGKVMVTACLDKLVRVYELQSHDRLQVYGGHSDMVMCMSVHKSVIYTGCYDGSIQAVQLNLMKNFRCWWQNCTLIFGTAEHVVQHLVRDHSNPNLQAVKCRWRDCSSFFATRQSVREKLPDHMQNHVASDSEVQP